MKAKQKGALADAALYAAAFAAGAVPFAAIDNMFFAVAAFTATATAVVFIASCALRDVSVYDPYWSVAPPVMLAAAMIIYRLYNANSFVLLAVISVWAARLTANWYVTYKGIGHEDWRYAQYREKYGPFVFHAISFFGLHFIPTAVVYGGMTCALFSIQNKEFSPLSLIGVAVMLASAALELVSDISIHRFLREHGGERRCCDISVWKYSRHPNYLGEMSFWTGLYIYFLAATPGIWYKGLAFLSIIALFLSVSIPMMEKHNAERRIDYEEYKAKTSMLLLLPPKKDETAEMRRVP